MQVIGNNSTYYWYLLEHEGRLIFETCCTSSVMWFTVIVELRDDEIAEYRQRGDAYLNEFSSEIDRTRPGRVDLGSPFLDRMLDISDQKLVSDAIDSWLDERESR